MGFGEVNIVGSEYPRTIVQHWKGTWWPRHLIGTLRQCFRGYRSSLNNIRRSELHRNCSLWILDIRQDGKFIRGIFGLLEADVACHSGRQVYRVSLLSGLGLEATFCLLPPAAANSGFLCFNSGTWSGTNNFVCLNLNFRNLRELNVEVPFNPCEHVQSGLLWRK